MTINTIKQVFYLSCCEAAKIRAATARGSAAAGGPMNFNGIRSATRFAEKGPLSEPYFDLQS